MEIEDCNLTKIDLLEHLNTVLNIPQKERILKTGSIIVPVLGDFGHPVQLLRISSKQVKEREFVEAPKLLICHFHYLVVTLLQCFRAEPGP